MSEVYQSTNKIPDSINPESLILGRGEFTINSTISLTSGFFGSYSIDLSNIKKQVVNPDVIISKYDDSGAPSYNRSLQKCPFTTISYSTGAVVLIVTQALVWSQGDALSCLVNVWTRTSTSNIKFFYAVTSMSVVKDNVLSPLP